MAVSSTSSGSLKTGVCLSTDRPDNPYNGQVIYETDTNRTLIYDNSAWVVISDPSLLSYSGTGATVTADAMTVAGENVTPYTGRRNLLYNGAMQVAQRGTSSAGITSAGYYTADRWRIERTSLGTWTQSVENDAPTGSGFSKSLKMLCTTADASPAANDFLSFRQTLEGQDLQHIRKGTSAAKQLTVSFWVKSNVTGTYTLELIDADNTRYVSASYSIDASATWEKKTITFPADTTGVLDNDNQGSLRLSFWLGVGTGFSSGTLSTSWTPLSNPDRAVGQTNLAAATNNYWQITGVQLEVGDKATPFEHRSYGEELALCQRYYWRIRGDEGDYTGFLNGSATGTTSPAVRRAIMPNPVKMRAKPTLAISANVNVQYGTGNGLYYAITSLGYNSSNQMVTSTDINGATSITAGQATHVLVNALGATDWFEASAEL